MINWKKPQKYINHLIVYFSVLSLILSVCWLVLYHLWMHQPELVIKYGNKMPQKYLDHINELQTVAENSNHPTDQVKRWQDLLKALDGVSSIAVHYELYTQTLTNLIDHWQKNEQYDLAHEAAEKWQKDYPYDFNAKFKYHQLLKHKDHGSALKYSTKLYEQFSDLDVVIERYFSDLLTNGQFDEALQVARHQQQYFVNNTMLKFVVYYKDKNYKNYHEDTKVHLPLTQYHISGQHYHVTMQRTFNQLKGLRLDIDQLKVNATIKNLSVSIKWQNKKYQNIGFKEKNHLKKIDLDSFLTTGSDPYFEIIVPEDMINTEQRIELIIDMDISYQQGFVINQLLAHKAWQVFYAQEHAFSENNSQKFQPTLLHDHGEYKIVSTMAIPKNTYQSVRVDFPEYQNFSAHSLRVFINDQESLSIKDIDHYRGVEKSRKNELIVKNNDPFVIFDLDSPTEIKQLHIEMILGKKHESI